MWTNPSQKSRQCLYFGSFWNGNPSKREEKKEGGKGKKKRKKRKGEKKDTGTATIGIIVVEATSDKTETSTQDVEVSQTIGGWREQERKASWVDRIKTIGKNAILQSYYTTWHIVGWHASLI